MSKDPREDGCWETAELSEVAHLIRGITFASKDKVPGGTPGSVPCLRTSNVQEKVELDDLLWVDEALVKRDEQWVQPGDTVISMSNSYELVGKVAIAPKGLPKLSFGAFLGVVRPNGCDPRFLFWFLRSPTAQAAVRAGASQTVNIANISSKALRSLSIPVPPPVEQRQIVDALDTHFSLLDDSVRALTQAKQNVKRARASILKAAVEGRLVPTEAALAEKEGREYEHGSDLLQRILAERKARHEEEQKDAKRTKTYRVPVAPDTGDLPELPEGWVWATVDHLIHAIQTGKSFSAEQRPPGEGETGILKVSAMSWGTYDETESKTVLDQEKIRDDLLIRTGDLLVSRANTIDLVGAVVLAGSVRCRVMLSDKSLRLVTKDWMKPWIVYALRSSFGRMEIELSATGNQHSMRNISQDGLRGIRVPLPPASEIHRIVDEIDRRFSILDAVEASIDANLKRCERLRQSILKWAFEGKLVKPEVSPDPIHAEVGA